MKNTSNQTACATEDMKVKEALALDAGQILFRSRVIMDPAPMPMVPITPIVIGKKIIKGAKSVSKLAFNRGKKGETDGK